MNAIRIKRRLESETLYLPEVRPLVGKDVEITVQEQNVPLTEGVPVSPDHPLRGSVLRYDDPFEPVAESDWEALR